MLSTTVSLAIFISLLQMFFVMDSKASLVFCVEILICTCIELKKLGKKTSFVWTKDNYWKMYVMIQCDGETSGGII